MFILAPKPTVVWPVDYFAPQDGGGFEKHTFSVRFNLPADQKEVEDLYRQIDESRKQMLLQLTKIGDANQVAVDASAADRHIVDKYFVGWPDGELTRPDGAVIPCEPETRAALLAVPGMRVAIVRAFLATLNGAAETKNSKPLQTTG